MRVLVCGSRTFNDARMFNVIMYGLDQYDLTEPTVFISGGANGADSLCRDYCEFTDHMGHFEEYPADWKTHGKSAGPIRNKQMLDEGKPDCVVAFIDKPLEESRGTNDMVFKAFTAGLPVYVIQKMLRPRSTSVSE